MRPLVFLIQRLRSSFEHEYVEKMFLQFACMVVPVILTELGSQEPAKSTAGAAAAPSARATMAKNMDLIVIATRDIGSLVDLRRQIRLHVGRWSSPNPGHRCYNTQDGGAEGGGGRTSPETVRRLGFLDRRVIEMALRSR